MSNIKIQPNGSGSGTFSIASPNSNTSRTLTLPDTTGVLLNDASSLAAGKLTGALPAIDGSSLTGVGGSTDFNAVGTYCLVANNGSLYWTTAGTAGGTRAGSTLGLANPSTKTTNGPLPGTWRQMQGTHYTYNGSFHWGLFVRIS